ncbi:MAG TPA: BMA_0021/BMA_0022 family TOMM bacteriocin [Polyangiaceae bacterium]|nr:BMA_0021/BMA_0022 family TOMM bacteriocin [Polyangiaceae bacterium]
MSEPNPAIPGQPADLPQLMKFRTVYLRAIALAWLDKEFKGSLQGDARRALHDAFHFEWPWTDLELKVRAEDEFEWIGNNWIWPAKQEDKLTLRIPLSPAGVARQNSKGGSLGSSPDHRGKPSAGPALAAYYYQRPSLLNGLPKASSIANNNFSVCFTHHFARHVAYGCVSEEPSMSGNDPLNLGFLPSSIGFANFEVALVSAMAAAWVNPNFAKALQNNPIAILRTIRKYSPPWNMIISIENDEAASYVADARNPGQGTWEHLSPHSLELCLPAAPKHSEQAIALAAYNATGAEYPFTCCF